MLLGKVTYVFLKNHVFAFRKSLFLDENGEFPVCDFLF